MLRPWTQQSASPRTVHVRWKPFLDHVDHASSRAPGRWTTVRPRKGTTGSRGRRDSGNPRGTPSSSQKNHQPAQARVLAHLAAIFDLLAQSSIHKTALGDCSLVCDSSNGPISFCSSALFIAKNFCLGDPVLELACQIYMVKSIFNA